MKIRLLVLDEKSRIEIKRVRDYAENHPYTISQIRAIQNGVGIIPGNNPNHVCTIPHGYYCAFTLDQAPLKDGSGITWLRHLSVSVGDGNSCPNPVAVNELMKEFGFRQQVCDFAGKFLKEAKLALWIENEHEPDMPKSINVIESYEKDE